MVGRRRGANVYVPSRADAIAELFAPDREPRVPSQPPIIDTWVCQICREWTMNGSYKVGYCTRCGTPR